MMVKSLTIELDVNEIHNNIGVKKINIGEIMTKYNFSIVEQSNEAKLRMVSNELLGNDNIIIGYACYNLEEINQINFELKKHYHSLDTIYIPSEKRIKDRIQKAVEEQRKWGYREGFTDEEIEKNFINFRATLEEIKTGLSKTGIKVEAV